MSGSQIGEAPLGSPESGRGAVPLIVEEVPYVATTVEPEQFGANALAHALYRRNAELAGGLGEVVVVHDSMLPSRAGFEP